MLLLLGADSPSFDGGLIGEERLLVRPSSVVVEAYTTVFHTNISALQPGVRTDTSDFCITAAIVATYLYLTIKQCMRPLPVIRTW